MAKPKGNQLGSGGDPKLIYVAKQSGSSQDPETGESMTFAKGVTRVRGGHMLLRLVPEYFEPVEDHVHYDVEQATKGPGEQRGARGAIAKAASRAGGKAAPTPEATTTTTPDATSTAEPSDANTSTSEPEPQGSRGIRLSDLRGGEG